MKKWIEKYRLLSPVTKAPIWYAVCSIIQNGIVFFSMPVFTNIMTAEQYGMSTVYQSWMAILVIFTTLNLQYGAFNNAMIKFEADRDRYNSAMQGLVLTLNAAFLAVYILLHKQWNEILGLSTIVMCAMFLEMSFAPAFGFWSGKKRFEYRYREVIAVTLAMAAAGPAAGVISVLLAQDKGTAKIVVTAGVNTLFYLVIFFNTLIKGKKLYVKEYWKYALGFNIPLIPYYLSQTIFNQSDRIMIDQMVGTDKAAIYGVVYGCSIVITFIINAINNAFVPWTYQRLAERNYQSLSKVANALSVFIGAMLLMVMLVSPEIIQIMAAEEYYEGIWTMPPIICSLFFLFLSQLCINVEFYQEKKKYLVLGSIFSALLNVGLNYWLIPVLGYIVAGYTTLAAYIVFAVANYIFMKKIMRDEKVYDVRFLAVLSVVMLVAAFVILISYHSFWIRAVMLLLISAMGIIFRKRIFDVIRNIRRK